MGIVNEPARATAEREIISRELSRERSARFIAKTLGRHHSTIAREIDRNCGASQYRAVEAQRRAEDNLRRPKEWKLEVREGGTVDNRAAHMVIGVDTDGFKHVLGIWMTENESAKFWQNVMSELVSRGVKDVLIVCCDGLTGLPEAIGNVWPKAIVQTCVVHLIRASMKFVTLTDRKASDGRAARWSRGRHGFTRLPDNRMCPVCD